MGMFLQIEAVEERRMKICRALEFATDPELPPSQLLVTLAVEPRLGAPQVLPRTQVGDCCSMNGQRLRVRR